jgi:transcriptional antiterminator Rof (Rho-off)
MTDYRPISCDRHSEYELLAMRRSRIRLDADAPEGPVRGLSCWVEDVYTRDGAEYLQVTTDAGERLVYRLDWIVALSADG